MGVLLGIGVGTISLLGMPGSALALLRYSASGASISGSLNGVSFVNASWTVSGLGDPATVEPITISSGPAAITAWVLRDVAPRVTVTTPSGSLEADLIPAAGFGWSILSGRFPVGPSPKIGFVYATADFSIEHAAGLASFPPNANPSLFNDLLQPASLAGASAFEAFDYATTDGALSISSFIPRGGTFTMAPVPAPLPLLGAGAALGWSRRLRRGLAALAATDAGRGAPSTTRRRSDSSAT